MKFHPSPELLIRYAAGSLSPALSFVVATHVKQCDVCRAQQDELETYGGDSIESCEDAHISAGGFADLWQQLEGTEVVNLVDQDDLQLAIASDYQPLLKRLIDCNYDELEWQSVGSKIKRASLSIDDNDNQIEILKFAGDAKIPQHTHKGNEFTVILSGSYRDEIGEFGAGDFIHLGQNDHHRPIAGKEGCVCIAVTDAPMHFTGMLGPVLNLFAR